MLKWLAIHDHPYLSPERALHVRVPGKNMLYVHIHWSEMYLDSTAARKAQDEVCFEWQWMRNAHTSAVWEVHVCTADDELWVSVSEWETVTKCYFSEHIVECRLDINCDWLSLSAGRVCSVALLDLHNAVSFPFGLTPQAHYNKTTLPQPIREHPSGQVTCSLSVHITSRRP